MGICLAVAYQLVLVRIQSRLLSGAHKNAPLLSVGGFVLRLMILGLIVVGLRFLTNLNMMVLLIAFIVVYTILSAVSLYRMTRKDRSGGPSSMSTQVLP